VGLGEYTLAGAALVAAGGAAYVATSQTGDSGDSGVSGGTDLEAIIGEISKTAQAAAESAGATAGSSGNFSEAFEAVSEVSENSIDAVTNAAPGDALNQARETVSEGINQAQDSIPDSLPAADVPDDISGLGNLENSLNIPEVGAGPGNDTGIAGNNVGADVGRDLGRIAAGVPVGILEGAWNTGGNAAEAAGTPEAFQAIQDAGARVARNTDKIVTGDAPAGDTISKMRSNLEQKNNRQNRAKKAYEDAKKLTSGDKEVTVPTGGTPQVADKAKETAQKAKDKAKKAAQNATGQTGGQQQDIVKQTQQNVQDAADTAVEAAEETFNSITGGIL
jgi:hypothetical protein